MRAIVMLLSGMLAGCPLPLKSIPETIVLQTGTSVKHEVDSAPVKVNTLNLNVTWRLK